MSDEIKVNPEEMRAAIQQMSNDLASVEGSISNVKCEITKNTCKNVVDFSQKVSDINAKMMSYIGKFKQNVTALGQAVNMVEDMDKSLKSAIVGQSTSAKIIAQQQNAQQQPVGTYDYKPSTSSGGNNYQYTYH